MAVEQDPPPISYGEQFPARAMKHGMILMWFRPIDEIPNGWHLCDGTDGYPDLREKFIEGASAAKAPCTDIQTNIAAGAGSFAHYLVFIAKT